MNLTMKLTCLLENTTDLPQLQPRHGLSLYLETETHRILFDFGPDDTFARNAEQLGIDLSAVDLAFLSHGHYDHGGGLPVFLDRNDHAPVYLHRNAFVPHWSAGGDNMRYIGLDQSLKSNPRIHTANGVTHLQRGLTLISGASGRRFLASSNQNLCADRADGVKIPDDFSHEQSLIVEENGVSLLIAGCAHSGIVNILEQAQAVAGHPMTHVISGFHLYQPSRGISEPADNVRAIAQALGQTPAQFFTCHCTGLPSYRILHEQLGEKIAYFSAGMQVDL